MDNRLSPLGSIRAKSDLQEVNPTQDLLVQNIITGSDRRTTDGLAANAMDALADRVAATAEPQLLLQAS